MKLNLNIKFDILQIISHCKPLLRCTSTQVNEVAKLNKNLYTPKKKVNNVCSIVVAINHVSWAKISLPDFSLIDWDAYPLSTDFQKVNTELNILGIANELSQLIPNSELYMMETQKKFKTSLNEIYLKAMLIFLLCLDKDKKVQDKLYLQQPSVLNRTFHLLVGSERKSTRSIVSNILELKSLKGIPLENKAYPDRYLSLEIPAEHESSFFNSKMEKQESLSLALLLSLSYSNINYSEKRESQNKEQVKSYFVKVS